MSRRLKTVPEPRFERRKAGSCLRCPGELRFDDKSLPKQVQKEIQLQTASRLSWEATLVRTADKLSNLDDVIHNPPVTWDRERRIGYLKWAESVVSNCPKASDGLFELFSNKVSEGRELFHA